MQLGIAFIVVGSVWCIFRKAIARHQFRIIRPLLRTGQAAPEQRTKAMERLGIMFALLLVLAGAIIAVLYLVSGR